MNTTALRKVHATISFFFTFNKYNIITVIMLVLCLRIANHNSFIFLEVAYMN